MTVHDLATQYHQQDTDYYCGAATAHMALRQCGAGILGQVGLYNDNHIRRLNPGGIRRRTVDMDDEQPAIEQVTSSSMRSRPRMRSRA